MKLNDVCQFIKGTNKEKVKPGDVVFNNMGYKLGTIDTDVDIANINQVIIRPIDISRNELISVLEGSKDFIQANVKGTVIKSIGISCLKEIVSCKIYGIGSKIKWAGIK